MGVDYNGRHESEKQRIEEEIQQRAIQATIRVNQTSGMGEGEGAQGRYRLEGRDAAGGEKIKRIGQYLNPRVVGGCSASPHRETEDRVVPPEVCQPSPAAGEIVMFYWVVGTIEPGSSGLWDL